MCQFQTLYHSDQIGYALRCTDCDKIQLAFGNIVLTLASDDFHSFRDFISKMNQEQPRDDNQHARCIKISAPCRGMQFLFSPHELQSLAYMLDAADSEMQSLELLELFQL